MMKFTLFALVGSMLAMLVGCSQPLTDQVELGAEQTQRAIVGYDETTYEYPVRVPETNRFVSIVVSEPLNYKPTYEDYLKWKKGEALAAPEPTDPTHSES